VEEFIPNGKVGLQSQGTMSARLLPISARSDSALKQLAASYHELCLSHKTNLDNLCYTQALHKTHHNIRLGITASSTAELARNLKSFLDGTCLSLYLVEVLFKITTLYLYSLGWVLNGLA